MTPEQIKDEVAQVCNLIFETYKDFNITDYRCILSLRDPGLYAVQSDGIGAPGAGEQPHPLYRHGDCGDYQYSFGYSF